MQANTSPIVNPLSRASFYVATHHMNTLLLDIWIIYVQI